MKKLFILSMVLIFAFSINAQNTKQLKIEKAPGIKNIIDNGQTLGNTVAPFRDPGAVMLGQSMNIYGILLSGPHQVMYNSAINTVAFIHRAPAGTGSGDSGELTFDYSIDGGATWTNNNWITPGMTGAGAKCRYPSITIYNPDGNTDVANARVIANGPALISGSSWGKTFEIDAALTASGTDVTDAYPSNTGSDQDFHPYGLEMGPDGTAWSASINFDGTNYLGDIYINKATWNGTQFDWTSPLFTITPAYNTTGGDMLFNGWDVAVDPTDGDHVYAVVNACVTGDAVEVPSPHVWETTNGGADWTLLDAVDYTEATTNTFFDTYISYNEGEPMKPYVTDVDATVDADGSLHIMTTVFSGANDWGYIYGLGGDGALSNRVYVDYIWDGTAWAFEYINDLECEEAPWGDVSTYLHPQISRTESGSHIFYTWSETFQDTDSLNKAPNMMARGWRTSDKLMMPVDSINLTNGTGAQDVCFFPQVSPIVIDHGADTKGGRFEIPMVVPIIDFAAGSDMDAPQYMYLSGFTVPESAWDVTGVNNINNKPEVLIYPNPTADIVTVSVGAKIEIYNILGSKVYSVEGKNDVTKIDMSNFNTGTYILKIYTKNGIVSKKIQVTK